MFILKFCILHFPLQNSNGSKQWVMEAKKHFKKNMIANFMFAYLHINTIPSEDQILKDTIKGIASSFIHDERQAFGYPDPKPFGFKKDKSSSLIGTWTSSQICCNEVMFPKCHQSG